MPKRARRKIGRSISLLLTVILVCSVLPINAFAKEETVFMSDEEPMMERTNIEEERESALPAEDDSDLPEEEVQEITDEKETPSSAESTDEIAISEEEPPAIQDEIAEAITENFGSPQPVTAIIRFDFDDGIHTEFYGIPVPVGEKITHRPADPTREGYLFKGWYGYLDENNEPVMWDFENDTVMANTTLWAAWEKAYLVWYDLDDGSYTRFYDVMVPEGGKVTDRPEDPTREGYLFKGWYGHLGENNEPVMWDFENDTIMANTTLWAAWEKTYLVMYDLNDGSYTQFYDVIVPEGGKVTDRPEDPTREGYLFKGWYGYLGENDEPVMWDFENDTVTGNMCLWAAWEKNSENGSNGNGESGSNGNGGNGESGSNGNDGNSESGSNGNDGNSESGSNGNDGNSESGNNSNSGNNAGGNGSSGSSGGKSSSKNGPIVTGKAGDNGYVNINEEEIPKSPGDNNDVVIDEPEVPKENGKERLDNLPKTGDDITSQTLYGALALISLFVLGMCLPYRKKNI